MTKVAEQTRVLTRQLEVELSCARDLLATLVEEFEALTNAGPDEIDQVCIEKKRRLAQLADCHTRRSQLLAAMGLPSMDTDLASISDRLPECGEILDRWQSLQQVARELKRQNEINGGIITMGQKHVRQALDLITGQSDDTKTYGRQGHQQAHRFAQTLAKA